MAASCFGSVPAILYVYVRFLYTSVAATRAAPPERCGTHAAQARPPAAPMAAASTSSRLPRVLVIGGTQFRGLAEMFGDGGIDMRQHRGCRQRRTHREEIAGGEVAQQVGVTRGKAEQVGRARDVAVERGRKRSRGCAMG